MDLSTLLDQETTVRAVDRQDMRGLLQNFPAQFQYVREMKDQLCQIPDMAQTIKNIVFSGMGGSGMGADIVRTYLVDAAKVPIIMNRNYSLPAFVDERSLVVFISYSGDTEETLEAFDQGLKTKAKMVVVASGGELAARAQKKSVPTFFVPKGLPPRMSSGYLTGILLRVLATAGFQHFYQENDFLEVEEIIKKLTSSYDVNISCKTNKAKQLAKCLFNRYPIIYGSADYLDVVALRWRGQIEENAKSLASHHGFPEMNHHELAGWDGPKELLKKFFIIALRDDKDHQRTQLRFDLAREHLSSKTDVEEVFSQGKSRLARIFSLIYLGDWMSYYLGILYGVDPTNIQVLQEFKARLRKVNK